MPTCDDLVAARNVLCAKASCILQHRSTLPYMRCPAGPFQRSTNYNVLQPRSYLFEAVLQHHSKAHHKQFMVQLQYIAGPFQRSSNYNVLEAAMEASTPYFDVCDDAEYAQGAKERFHAAAQQAGTPAIITGT